MKYILKYTPEITIKSRSVRSRFARQLGKNLQRLIKSRVSEALNIQARWDYVEISAPDDLGKEKQLLLEEILGTTSGIHSWERVSKHLLGDLDEVLHHTLAVYEAALKDKTFAVRCKRSGRHPFNSMDVERFVGAGLNQHTETLGVNLSSPDVEVGLEIRDQDLFVVEERQKGLGGFPQGSQDGVLSLLSGGFDSAVASFLSMRRGLRTHFCFFNLGGVEHEVAVKEVALYLWMKYGAARSVRFVTVPFEGVVEEILTRVENSQMGVVLKRMMLRAADRVAEDMNLEALVTGESVAQVSSQTLANLAIIDQVCDTMVLRPLIMAEKQDIVDMAREIGTEAFSASIPEYCGVISVKPTTRARAHRIEKEESRFNFEILEQALAAREVLAIDRLQLNQEAGTAIPEVTASLPEAAVVIDIRHPEEEEMKPLQLPGTEVRKIPFYRLSREFAALDSGICYLLYCDKGIMSRLHASFLLNNGYDNVAVYRP